MEAKDRTARRREDKRSLSEDASFVLDDKGLRIVHLKDIWLSRAIAGLYPDKTPITEIVWSEITGKRKIIETTPAKPLRN